MEAKERIGSGICRWPWRLRRRRNRHHPSPTCKPSFRDLLFRGPVREESGTRGLAMQIFFALTLFVSATLLFVVQPMFAKMALPLLGGTPNVWNWSWGLF